MKVRRENIYDGFLEDMFKIDDEISTVDSVSIFWLKKYSYELELYKESMYKILRSLEYLIKTSSPSNSILYKVYKNEIFKNIENEEKIYRKSKNYILKNIVSNSLTQQKSVCIMRKIKDF